jgi:hypothetical protein
MKSNKKQPTGSPVAYSAEAVIAWLEKVRPAVPWRELVADKLPPVVWRSRWNTFRDSLGLPYSAGMMANLDSDNKGPVRLGVPQ